MPGVGWECHVKGDGLGRPAEKVTLKQRPERGTRRREASFSPMALKFEIQHNHTSITVLGTEIMNTFIVQLL